MTDLKLVATTFYGLENVLTLELSLLGAKNISPGNRSVSFQGDLGFMYKANYNLRTALRVLRQIKSVSRIYNAEHLYKAIQTVDWQQFMSVNDTFRIDVTGQTKYFKNTRFIALKAKDAIVDQFKNIYNRRPDIALQNPDLHIILHFNDSHLNISLDSSGEPLYKRGYRTATNQAPLNEVLAAGLVALSNWNGLTNFLDPMCGSGTLLIEAAMSQMNIPAAINRKAFAFQNWKDYDNDLFETITEASINKITELPEKTKITGYDINPKTLSKARQNIKNANLDSFIQVKLADFFETTNQQQHTFLLFNPPYDERISIDLQNFYKKIGDTLKNNYPGTTAWMLIGNLQALKHVGLRTSKRIKLYNGKIEARLVQYKLFQGSFKQKNNNQ